MFNWLTLRGRVASLESQLDGLRNLMSYENNIDEAKKLLAAYKKAGGTAKWEIGRSSTFTDGTIFHYWSDSYAHQYVLSMREFREDEVQPQLLKHIEECLSDDTRPLPRRTKKSTGRRT